MSSSSWWYGVALFPIVLVMRVIYELGWGSFATTSMSASDPDPIIMLAGAGLAALSFWSGVIVALIVLACLIADIRRLRHGELWSPSLVWILAGVVHVVGIVFSPLLVLSTPALSSYLYRRHNRIGAP
jgi:hypothetical protein